MYPLVSAVPVQPRHKRRKTGWAAAVARRLRPLVAVFSAAAIGLSCHAALAQGSVTGVTVTASPSTESILLGSSASFGASVTTGSPQPTTEWNVTGGPTYAWSASNGSCNPTNAAETSVTSIVFPTSGDKSVGISATVSYTVRKDDGTLATITGSNSKSVLVHVDDFGIGVAPGALTIDSGGQGGATLTISYTNGDWPSSAQISLSSTVSGDPNHNIGVSFGNQSGINSSSYVIPVTISAADGTNNGVTDQHYTVTLIGTSGNLVHSTK